MVTPDTVPDVPPAPARTARKFNTVSPAGAVIVNVYIAPTADPPGIANDPNDAPPFGNTDNVIVRVALELGTTHARIVIVV